MVQSPTHGRCRSGIPAAVVQGEGRWL